MERTLELLDLIEVIAHNGFCVADLHPFLEC